MKQLLFLLFMFCTLTLVGQSPYSITNSRSEGFVNTQQISMANPWVGAKLAYSFDEEAPLDDNFLFSAKVLYTPVAGTKYAIPVVSSAGLGSSDLLNPESGINIGIYPFYKLVDSERFSLVGHGGIGYKLITKGVEEGEDAPQQIRLVGGLEAALWGNQGPPATVSITPVYLYHTKDLTESTGMLEITTIVPVGNGLGIMAEGQLPFKQDEFNTRFRFGVVINGKL